jgi:ferrochelatase
VCDHVEVLYDLDVEARGTAAAVGLTLHRAAAVNDHPAFITALADLVLSHAATTSDATEPPANRHGR